MGIPATKSESAPLASRHFAGSSIRRLRAASVRVAAGLGLRLGRSRRLGGRGVWRVRVAHTAPGIGRDLCVRYLLQRFLVRVFLRLIGFLLFGGLGGCIRE